MDNVCFWKMYSDSTAITFKSKDSNEIPVENGHMTIYTDKIDRIEIEEHPDGIFAYECNQVFNVFMKDGNVVSIGLMEF